MTAVYVPRLGRAGRRVSIMAEQKYIEIRGAREHNLKGIDVNIPRDQLVVINGLSGSGKSSGAMWNRCRPMRGNSWI